MRKKIRIPKILKINWIKDLSISVVFNNGESRIIDFHGIMKNLNLLNSPAKILLEAKELSKGKYVDNTISWDNIGQYITMKYREKKEFRLKLEPMSYSDTVNLKNRNS